MTAVAGHGDRLAYVDEAAGQLWPGAEVTVTRAGGRTPPGEADFLLLPDARRPRLLVPAASRRAAATAVLGYGESASRAARWRGGLLAAGLRLGVAQRVLRDRVRVHGGRASLTEHLAGVLDAEVSVGLYLSAPRANRKPVLQLLDPDGRRLGFAKVGVNPLTCRLVRAETAALQRLARTPRPGLVVPQVLHSGAWNGLEVLVQSPLPLDGRPRPVRAGELTQVMREVADLDRTDPGGLTGSPFWAELCTRVGDLPDGPSAAALAAVVSGLHDVAGSVAVGLGSWHGDWTPWNMRAVRDGLAVWDWERFAAHRPVGFDALHHGLQRDLVSERRDPAQAVQVCVDGAAGRLAPYGVDAETALVTALCYLCELATRYTEDGQADAGARLGRVQDWLIPTLRSRMERCRR